MGKTYERNMADTALVVKSLKVLENIDGGGIKEIKNTVESVKRQTTAQAKQQEEYWKTLSDDGVISVIEKQTLYRETQNIARSYAAITQQAQALGMPSTLVADYIATYNELHVYLYTTLKIFDDMSVETRIDDRDTFNAYFSNYYFSENFVLIAITNGILDSINFRVLQSLTESGTEGETAIYHGGLYQYINGQWKSVSTGAYKGPRNELPADEEEAFFIVSESFTMTEGLIVNGEELYVNGDLLGITHTYLKGQIYYFQDGIWKAEHDRTNWRYAAAFADVINITGELPQIFQDAIDDLQEQINTKASAQSLQEEIAARQGQYTIINGDIVQINSDITEIVERVNDQQTEIDGKINHLPVYFGGRSSEPENPQEGDFFVWTGATYGGWVNSKIYKYTSGNWVGLSHTETANRSYYMMALEDILATNNAGEGYFSYVFAQSFFGNDATINSLATKTIYLRQGGYLQSDNTTYVAQQNGTKIDYDGNIDANGNTHIGGNCTIDGSCTIGGIDASTISTRTYAETKSDAAEAAAKDTIAVKLGYASYNDMVAKVAAGKAITDGTGKLNASIIDAILIKGLTGIFTDIEILGNSVFHGALSGATGTFNGVVKCSALDITNIQPGNYKLFPIVTDPNIQKEWHQQVEPGRPFSYVLSGYHQILGSGKVEYRCTCSTTVSGFAESVNTYLRVYLQTDSAGNRTLLGETSGMDINYSLQVDISAGQAVYVEFEIAGVAKYSYATITITPRFSNEGVFTSEPNNILKYLGDLSVNGSWK